MPSYEHKKIIEDIKRLDELPPSQEDFGTWIQAGAHLESYAETLAPTNS